MRRLKNNEESSVRLKASQKAWIEYRNIQCDFEGWEIGTPMYSICPIRINEQRISELKFIADEILL